MPIASRNIVIHDILVFGFVFVAAALGWLTLKKVLLQQKELKEFQFKANRFYRNYENFKTILISKGVKDLVSSPFVFGNPTSKTQITIITNPFCGHCEKAHYLLDDILEKNKLDLCINFIINVDLSRADDVNKLFYRNLMNIYLQKGSLAFRAAFQDWFKKY